MLRPAASKKGFGTPPTSKDSGKSGAKESIGGSNVSSAQQLSREDKALLDDTLREVKGKAPKASKQAPAGSINGPARPISAEEAARGKLDMVTVKGWGSGDPTKLGDLEIQAVQSDLYRGGSTGGGGTVQLYEQLARELQAVEARGLAKVAGGPAVPLQKWSFKEAR